MFAALFNLVGLTFEALELHLWGVNIALIFHGLHCFLIGFPVGLPASNARRADGPWRLGLADRSVNTTHRPPVTLQRGLRLRRRRIAHALAPSDRAERSAMEGAGQRSASGWRAIRNLRPMDGVELQRSCRVKRALRGRQPCRGIAWGLIETIKSSAGTCSLRCFQILIGSIDPHALKIPAPKGGILTNGKRPLSISG